MDRDATHPRTLFVELGERRYAIVVGHGLLDDAGRFAAPRGRAALVVSDDVVSPLYGARVCATLARLHERVDRVTLAAGEAHKAWPAVNTVIDALAAGRHDRTTTVYALGGGVVGDVAGFAAACYMRGTAFVQLPTTLLAQVDSAVGGKTGVNHPAGKNLIGAFHQPDHVVADVATLASLPRRELVAGVAEVIKYGATLDSGFLDWIEAHLDALLALDAQVATETVHRSCAIKAAVVAADEREAGRRAILNFGHTFAHALELELGYGTWLHGEAVGCGMVLAARLSERLGLIASARADRLEALVARAGLPTRCPGLEADRLLAAMASDKKTVGGEQRFVLLTGAHESTVGTAPARLIREVLVAHGAA